MVFDIICKAIRSGLPKRALLGEPGFCGGKLLRIHPAGADTADLFGSDETVFLENTKVLHERGQPHIEGLRQFFHRRGAAHKAADDGPPGGIGERVKGGIQGAKVLHMENYR